MTSPDQQPHAAPDWSTIPEQIHCPLCEYNLRGLDQPRCPECGYCFEWSELLDPTRRAHPYIFEHHPERDFWSFRKTFIAHLNPETFWRDLHPAQPSNLGRILLYAILTYLPLLLAWTAYSVVIIVLKFAQVRPTLMASRSLRSSPPPTLSSLSTVQLMFNWELKSDNLFNTGLACILWPWLTLAGVMIFRWSMKKANVKPIHVLRCLIYCSDLLLLLFPLFLLLGAEISGLDPFNAVSREGCEAMWNIALLVALPLFIYRLVCAYRQYLRFDRPIATVLSAQVIAALALWKLLLVLHGY